MYKPDSLRKHLVAAVPEFKRNPDKLLVFADEGVIVASATPSLSFEYRYKLNIIITDYKGDSNAIMVPLLAWTAIHQPELHQHPEKQKTGIAFEVDFNSKETVDLSLKIELTERVIVKRQADGKLEITKPQEPQPTPEYSADFWTLTQGAETLAQWHTPGLDPQ